MATILLVEDNEFNRDMLSRRLMRRGYQLILAGDGKAALAMASMHRPDLILMDLSLPVMDGFEALAHLKGIPETRNIPVIALTAHALVSDRERTLQAGFDDYDIKPIDFSRLLNKIATLLDIGVGPPQDVDA